MLLRTKNFFTLTSPFTCPKPLTRDYFEQVFMKRDNELPRPNGWIQDNFKDHHRQLRVPFARISWKVDSAGPGGQRAGSGAPRRSRATRSGCPGTDPEQPDGHRVRDGDSCTSARGGARGAKRRRG